MIKEIKEIEFDTETGTFSVITRGLNLEDSLAVIKAIAARKYHYDTDKEAQIMYMLSKAVDAAY